MTDTEQRVAWAVRRTFGSTEVNGWTPSNIAGKLISALAADGLTVTTTKVAAIGAVVEKAWIEYQDCEMPGICTDIFMSAIEAALEEPPVVES